MPATLTLKNIPDAVNDRLKLAAEMHCRSLNSEAIACLEVPVKGWASLVHSLELHECVPIILEFHTQLVLLLREVEEPFSRGTKGWHPFKDTLVVRPHSLS
ncbi:MAG: Arc family DNA-binding protein [Rhodocyclaceae bacterium]|nr:Arc family DNA-binding protein [Rhodocyclaceae bacterium]